MKLIIAEKPSVAQEIAKVIGAKEKKNSYIQGNGYIVSWCYGHLVGLAQPNDYDEKYKKWTLEDLPIIPKEYELKVNDDTKDHFYMLKNLMNREDIEELICATDSGREGELIFRFVYEKANCKKPFKRLWVSSLTEESIKNGFENLKDGSDYDHLFQAGMKRAISDWIVGLNATRMYSLKYGNKITVGRVQTPTLAIIVNREKEFTRFKKVKNYKIILEKAGFQAESDVFTSKIETENTFKKIKNKPILCTASQKKNLTKSPPKLYDLTLLQRDCNKILGLTAQETLNIAQNLYEKKLITYPRTDSNYISNDMGKETSDIVNKIYNEFDFINTEKVCKIQNVINNDEISDHHAIIPTKAVCFSVLKTLSVNEKNVLKLICKRLIEAVHKKTKFYRYIYSFQAEDVKFDCKYDYIYDFGYLEIENIFMKEITGKEKVIDNNNCKFEFKKGEKIDDDFEAYIHDYFTSPPKRYTEDTLLSVMENVVKDDYKEYEETGEVFEKKGLGTPATRANTIEKLIKVGYIERKGNSLIPTQKGISAIDIVDEKIKSPTMTLEWEVKLQQIEKGNYSSGKFLNEIVDFTKSFTKDSNVNQKVKVEMEKLNQKAKKENHLNEVIGSCPTCKNPVFESEKNFYCSNKECSFVMFKEDKFFKEKKVKLTKIKVKTLLKSGQVEFDKLYSEKKNKFYSAKVSFEVKGKYVNYKLKFD